MAMDPFAAGQGKQVSFTGVDSLVLYTLTPGGKSEFMNVKLCRENKCADHEYLKIKSALAGISSSHKVLLATLLIYLSLL
jgi:hypothetical protein